MRKYFWSRYRHVRGKLHGCFAAQQWLSRGQATLVRLVPIGGLSLMLLFVSGVALAAPAPAGSAPAAQVASVGSQGPTGSLSGSQGGGSSQNQQAPAANPTPICQTGDSSTTCAQHLTGTLSDGAKAIYQIGIWVAIVVAVLVIIWTTPPAIVGAATSNSKVIGQLAARIAIIVALILLAINSWSILQFFLGSSGQSISPPSFPTINGG
ncbi:MAG TPA: hypothetical protein VF099_12185 [Ktedonobacterales bacterium]